MKLDDIQILRRFVPGHQMNVILDLCTGEEGDWFREKIEELALTASTMPETYQQDREGENAIVFLHYFTGAFDWYITERDKCYPQYQAFGLACMHEEELGYINIVELVRNKRVELDLHWTPRALWQVRAERERHRHPSTQGESK